jgi:hypothetical protein
MGPVALKFFILGAMLLIVMTAPLLWSQNKAYFLVAMPLLLGFQPFLDYGYSQTMGILFVPFLWLFNVRFGHSGQPFKAATNAWYVWISVIAYGVLVGLNGDAYKLDWQNLGVSPTRQIVEVTSGLVASLWLLKAVNAQSHNEQSEEQLLMGAMFPLFLVVVIVFLISVGLAVHLPQFLSGSGTIDDRMSGGAMRLGVVFGEPTVLAYMAFGFICWSHILLVRRPKNPYAVVCLLASAIIGLLTGTRAFIAMLVLYASVLAISGVINRNVGRRMFGRSGKPRKLIVAVAAALTVTVVYYVWNPNAEIFQRLLDTGRERELESAAGVFAGTQRDPILGFRLILDNIGVTGGGAFFLSTIYGDNNVGHNLFLGLFARFGFAGVICFAYIWLVFARMALAVAARAPVDGLRAEGCILFAAMVCFFGESLVSGSINSFGKNAMLYITMALIWNGYERMQYVRAAQTPAK